MNLDELKIQAVNVSIKKLLNQKYFSICDIDNVAKVMGRATGNEAYKILHTLHCMNYSDMTEDLRRHIPSLIKEALGCELPDFDKAIAPAQEPKQEKNSFLRLLGAK